jgi:uncharacterized protein YcgI (DUF1989 family)
MVLMSQLGRAMASVTGSSVSWHDAITGHSLDRHVAVHGESSYALHRNDWRRSARALLLDELYSLGLGPRDLHANVNWFTKIAPLADERGSLAHHPGNAVAGDWVTMRAELDLLVVVATASHPMAARPTWPPAGVNVEITTMDAPTRDDPSRVFRAESARALQMSERSLR